MSNTPNPNKKVIAKRAGSQPRPHGSFRPEDLFRDREGFYVHTLQGFLPASAYKLICQEHPELNLPEYKDLPIR